MNSIIKEIVFGKPQNITPRGLDQIVLSFPFTLRQIGRGAIRDTVSEHNIIARISGTLLSFWGFERSYEYEVEKDLFKTLFEFARQQALSKIEDGTFGENEEVKLFTNTAPKKNPFDPLKIPDPEGQTFIIQMVPKADLKAEVDTSVISPPKAFISYSWDSQEHKNWVYDLATKLRGDGVDVTLDQWHLHPGDLIPKFMDRSIAQSDVVLIICTPNFKVKAEKDSGGVGYEDSIMTSELYSGRNRRKFIPILRQGSWAESAPNWLKSAYGINLSGDPYSYDQYKELLITIHKRRPEAPPLGNPPDFLK